MKKSAWLGIVLGLIVPAAAWAASPDAEYVTIYQMIQEGDHLAERDQADSARDRYEMARERLRQLREDSPSWNPSVVEFRLKYLAERLAGLESQSPASAAEPDMVERTLATSGISREALEALKARIGQLEQEKSHLQARLNEALQPRPAEVNPQELQKAERQVEQLTKEKALLQAELEKAEARIADLTLSATATETSDALADARKKIQAQSDELALLKLEKEALQRRLDEVVEERRKSTTAPAPADRQPRVDLNRDDAERQARRALLKASNQIEQLQEEQKRLIQIRDQLQNQVARLTESNQRLETEKAALQAEVVDLKSRLQAGVDTADLTRSLNEARRKLAASQAENQDLKREKEKLASQLESLDQRQSQTTQTLQAENDRKSREISELKAQLTKLEAQLESTNAKLAEKSRWEDRSKLVALNNEILLLKSRLNVLQAQKQPYSEEELALFEKPEEQVEPAASEESAERDPEAGLKSLPPGAGQLVAEAEHAFYRGRFAEAEAKYRQVLDLDQENVFVLSNLAATLLQQKKNEEAEALLEKAIELDPKDPHTLRLLGVIRFTQKDYDRALDLLSLAAREAPKDAEIQTYLGMALSEKGLREPAESALRKALELTPNHPLAHYNLAVVYALQEPPFPALADWHYRKATANGHPRSPQLEELINQ